MQTQLHISTIADLVPHVAAVENMMHVKPKYGFWTSTYADGSSGWVDWCRDNQYGDPDTCRWYLLEPSASARVYTIDSLTDLEALPHIVFFSTIQYLDFEAISRNYDAIRLTEGGQWATRFSTPGLYGWDCECTLWFRWCFDSYRCIVPASLSAAA